MLHSLTAQPPSTQTTIPPYDCLLGLSSASPLSHIFFCVLIVNGNQSTLCQSSETINSEDNDKGAKPYLPHMYFIILNTCVIFLNVKTSEKCPLATCLYNHKPRTKHSNPVLLIWNFKKNNNTKLIQ